MNEPRIADRLAYVGNSSEAGQTRYPEGLNPVLSAEEAQIAQGEISLWPGYRPTPSHALPALAERVRIGALVYKDEGERFGIGSFKALGGAYAVLCQLKARFPGVSTPELLNGEHAESVGAVTVCGATDGNHGRAVAWGAQMFGGRCVIYVHRTVSEGRVAAIERYGAQVVRHHGNYDETVHRIAVDADANGWTVVSDTSYAGYTDIPRDVMHGYTLMAREAFDQWPLAGVPTHLLVPGGVGAVAAAVCAASWWRFGAQRPRCVVVEPTRAACLMESACRGRRTTLQGDIETIMAGLSCGEPSELAWTLLARGASGFMAVDDDAVREAMRVAAEGRGNDPAVVSGESAASVIAALMRAHDDTGLRDELGLNRQSRVLLFGTEGDTDPEIYARIVGRTGAEVRRA